MPLPQTFSVRAVQISRKIVLRKIPHDPALSAGSMFFPHGEGFVSLFRYGVAVFMHVPLLEQQHIIDHTLKPYLEAPLDNPEEESVDVMILPGQSERVHNERVYLLDDAIPRLQVLCEVLARSVLLAGYEARINQSFDLVEPLAERLARNRGPRTGRQLLHTIGAALVTEHDMVGRAAVTEKPDILWDHADLEGLYLRLADEFELQERDSALARKISLVSRTAHTALELLQAGRSLRVEWYIVLLIVFEIFLTLFELFVRHPS